MALRIMLTTQREDEEGDGWKDPEVRVAVDAAILAQASSWLSGLVLALVHTRVRKPTCAETLLY